MAYGIIKENPRPHTPYPPYKLKKSSTRSRSSYKILFL